MLSSTKRISKLYTVLTKPSHKRSRDDLRLVRSLLQPYLQSCLNPSRSLPLNDNSLLRQLCRFITLQQNPSIISEHNLPLYHVNQDATTAFIVLQGEVCERRIFNQSEIISVVHEMNSLIFRFDQTLHCTESLLNDFVSEYSAELIVARNKAATLSKKVHKISDEDNKNNGIDDISVADMLKAVSNSYYLSIKPRLQQWGKALENNINELRDKRPGRDKLPKEKNLCALTDYLDDLNELAVKFLHVKLKQKIERKFLRLEQQKSPNVKNVEGKMDLMYEIISKIEDIVFQICLFLCDDDGIETLSSYRSTDERRSYLSEKGRKILEIKEATRKFGAIRKRVSAWRGTVGNATFTKSKAKYLNTAVCTGISGATLAVLSRDQLLPILQDGFQNDMLNKTKFIRGISEFKLWSSTKLIEMLYRTEQETFESGSKLISRGSMAKFLYIIYSGFVTLYTPVRDIEDKRKLFVNISDGHRGKKYREMGPGTILGEKAILNGSIVHGYTEAVAKTQVVTLKLKRSVFDEMFLSSANSKKVFQDSIERQKESKQEWRRQWNKLQKIMHPTNHQSVYTSISTLKQHQSRAKMVSNVRASKIRRGRFIDKKKGQNKAYLVESIKSDLDRNQIHTATWIRTDEERKEDQQRYKAQELLGSEQDVLLAVKEALREEMEINKKEQSPDKQVLDSSVEIKEYSVDIKRPRMRKGKYLHMDRDIEIQLPRKQLLEVVRGIFQSTSTTV